MLALSPPLFQAFGWPVEDSINHELNIYRETEVADSLVHFPLLQPQVGNGDSSISEPTAGDASREEKKVNHNASESDRRKKINNLYSFLRSLLPDSEQTKKLSIPSTISQVLKYIPELQREVDRLIETKEEISSRITRQGELLHIAKQRETAENKNYLCFIPSSPLGDREVTIRMSTVKPRKSLLSEAIQILEKDGLLLVNASSFESFGQRDFNNLHFQVQGPQDMEIGVLRTKLSFLCEKMEDQIIFSSSWIL